MAKKKTKVKSKMKKKAVTPKRKAAKKTPARKAVSRPKPAARKKPVARRKPAARRSSSAAAKPAEQKSVQAGTSSVTPILVVRNMSAAIHFYTNGLGFTLLSAMPGPDGQLMHAELSLNNSLIMLGPEAHDRGSFAPQGPSPVTLYILVGSVDDVAARAAGMGGNLVMPPADMFWGDRCAMVVDQEGHRWMIATHVRDLTPEEMMDAAAKEMGGAPPTT